MRTVVAKDTMLAMVKLATKTEESTCGLIDYNMVSYSLAYSQDEAVESNALVFISQKADCRKRKNAKLMEVNTVMTEKETYLRITVDSGASDNVISEWVQYETGASTLRRKET